MAASSRQSYYTDDNADMNATSAVQPSKRLRFSTGSEYRQRARARHTPPLAEFEDLYLKPAFRGSLHLDERFLPYGEPLIMQTKSLWSCSMKSLTMIGLQPGTILEIKGAEKSGKTFLLTYLIVRALTVYPEKKVILIDSRHKFNVKNLVSILCHFDPDLRHSVGEIHSEQRKNNLFKPLPTLLKEFPRIISFLDRIKIIRCYSAEDLMLTFGPTGKESVIHNMLLQDKSFCLIAVDCIDNFSHSESLVTSAWVPHLPNIMHLLKDSVNATRCPVICTTLIPAEKHEYKFKRKSLASVISGSAASIPVSAERSNEWTTAAAKSVPGSGKGRSQEKQEERIALVSNFVLDYTVFSYILELIPVAEAEKAKLVHRKVNKITHCAIAYLRSRHNANTAGSGKNQRVKFSIFSDMLWVF